MKSYPKLKTIIKSCLLLAGLSLYVFSSGTCSAKETEKTYLVTETQLTQLETNLTTLKTQNETLQQQLQISQTQVKILQEQSKTLQTQSTQLQEQVQALSNSLTNAQTLLSKYEASQQAKKYSVGIGLSNNSLALNADYKKIWLFLDTETVAVGYKIDF